MAESRSNIFWLLILALTLFGRAASAVDVSVQVPGAPQDVVSYFRQASLTVETAAKAEVTTQDVLAAARADYSRILGALYELGHYGGVINILVDGREAAGISPVGGPSRIDRVVLRVVPGPRFTFSMARVAPLASGTKLPEGFVPGAPAYAGTVGDAASAGIDGWRNAGHAMAGLAGQSITADHRKSALAADIRLSPGPRLTFGNLIVSGQTKVRPDRVRQIAGLPTGQVYSPEALDTAGRRLRRTGAFRSVVLEEAETAGPGNTLDITAALVDQKPRRIGVGVEIWSLEGLSVSAFWLHRNILGGAERLRFDAEISGIGGDSGGIDYRLAARFDRPATFTPETSFYFELELEDLDEPNFGERHVQIGTGLTHRFSETLKGEIGLAYQYTEVRDALGARTLEHLLLPARLTFDTRDEPLDAHRGVYLDVEFTPFAGTAQGGIGARLYSDARSYLSLAKDDRLVIAGRMQLGSIVGAGLTEVPPDTLFFSGGAGTVRGQPYQSLGAGLVGGTFLGGRSFLAFATELRAGIDDTWSVVAFADTGFVGRDNWGTGNGDWHSGAGFGVRYDTGIGPIRLDIATPLDSDAGEDFEIYVGIGQAF